MSAIVWPHGTSWDKTNDAVLLADGQTVVPGDRIDAYGGAYKSAQLADVSVLGPMFSDAALQCGLEDAVVIDALSDVVVTG